MRNNEKFFRNSRVTLVLLGSSLTLLGGCSGNSIGDFMGQDLTSLASNSILAITGQESVDARNERLVLRTRAPLVVPPGNGLQNPGTENQTTALLGTNWPDDPDVRARAELAAAEAERKRVDPKKNSQAMLLGRNVPLTVEEMRRGKPNPNRPREEIVPGGPVDRSRAVSPEELLGRRLDPNRPRDEQAGSQRLVNMSPQERLMEPPRRNAAPVSSPADLQQAAPEKKSVMDRLQFWKRD